MKRKIKRLLTIIAGIWLLALIICSIVIFLFFPELLHPDSEKQAEAVKELFAMDTYITMTAYGKDAEIALSEAESRLTELEQHWSVTNSGSDIYAVNHSNGQAVSVSKDTVSLLSFALQMSEETNGALEPTLYPVLTAWGFTTEENRVPSDTEITALLENVDYKRVRLDGNSIQLEPDMMLDLGAVGKGYAGDEAANVLRENGITSALINLGGNIQAIGSKPDGTAWRLGLRDPFSDGTFGVLEVRNLAVVTSGNYERYFIGEDGRQYGHIINPATGYPAESELVSATVVAEEGRLCDALSTALFVMGLDRAVDYWQEHQNFDMILLTKNGEIYLTNDIVDAFTLNSDHNNMKVNVIEDE